MRITQKLNIVHIIHFTLMLSAVFVINFFILKEVAYRNLSAALNAMCLHLDHYINAEVDAIDQAAVLSGTSIIANHKLLDRENQILQNLNGSIEGIDLKETNNENLIDTSMVLRTNSQFLIPFGASHQIVVNLKPDWLNTLLIDFYLNNPYSIIILDRNSELLYSNTSKSNIQKEVLLNEDLQKSMDAKYLKGIDIKNIKLFDDDAHYMAHVTFNKKLNVFLLVYMPNAKIFGFLRHYPLTISIIFGLILIFLLSMVIRTNIRYTKPLRDIAQSLADNSGIQKKTSELDEIMFIKRSIDTIQNQLDFYSQNLGKASVEHQKIEKDIQVAKHLQRNILPKNVGEIARRSEFQIYADSEAVFDLGGDFYDYFMLDSSRLMFAIADIAGKGIPASLFTIFTHTLLRTVAKPELTVREIITKLNNKLIENNISDLFVTMILGIMDVNSGVVEFSNAAHNLPFIIRENGTIEEIGETHGIPLGIYANRNYNSSTVELMPNDQLLFYTDGLTDSKDENGMLFTIDVLKYNLMGAWFRTPEEVVKKIQNDIKSFRGTADPVDDTTLMVLKFIHRNNN